jgi:hypothetical protein
MGEFIVRGNGMYFITLSDESPNKVHPEIVDVPGGI